MEQQPRRVGSLRKSGGQLDAPSNSLGGHGRLDSATRSSVGSLRYRLADHRAAGIRDSRWKDLRHTYATRLNAHNGVGMKTIATLLGHTTTRMTERYTHVTELLAAVQGVGRARSNEPVAPKMAPKTDCDDATAVGSAEVPVPRG